MKKGRVPARRRGEKKEATVTLQVPTMEDLDANEAAGTFFRVDRPEGGKATLSIRGAKSMWKTNPNFIYVPGPYIAGAYEAVREALMDLTRNNENEVNLILSTAITSQNFNVPVNQGGQMETYEQVFDDYARKQEVLKHDLKEGLNSSGKPFVTLDMLPYILSNIKIEKKTGLAPTSARSTSARKPRSRRAKGLAERLNNLAEGKVLDVSKLTLEGTGAITIKTPGEESSKVGDIGLGIVSNNLPAYELALTMISEETGEDVTQLAGDWQALHDAQGRTKRKTPVRKGKEKVGERKVLPLLQRKALPPRRTTPLGQGVGRELTPPPRRELTPPPRRELTPPPRRELTPPPRELPPLKETIPVEERVRRELTPPRELPPPPPRRINAPNTPRSTLTGRTMANLNLNALPSLPAEGNEEENVYEEF